MPQEKSLAKFIFRQLLITFWLAVGAFLTAISIRVFLIPNNLIDGGVIGVTLILSRLFGSDYLPFFLVTLTLPFLFLAYRYIRRIFVFHMLTAVLLFAGFLYLLAKAPIFLGEPLEIIVIGGVILGIGAGIIIRFGGCIDGSEILAILIHRKKGFTVGQVVLFINVFVFSAYGWIFKDWHIALQSLMMYFVAYKVMDVVIVGLDELKSVIIISSKPKELTYAIINELGLGLTVVHGKGGYSGKDKEILFVFVERLDIADLKAIVLREDPSAFMAIENVHEVVYGKQSKLHLKKRRHKFLPLSPEID